MSENQNQGNEGNENQGNERQGLNRSFDTDNVPEYRLEELNRKKKDAEKRAKEAETKLQKLETEQQQAEEQRASQQGEYQQLAEKRQKKIDQLNTRVQELENQIVQDKRYRSFVSASNGTILPEAFDDAFSMLTDDEWSSVNEDDENGVRMLAQGLAERKPYLAAAPRGSGSGGSRQPVFGSGATRQLGNGSVDNKAGARPFQFKAPQKHWK